MEGDGGEQIAELSDLYRLDGRLTPGHKRGRRCSDLGSS